MNLVINDFNSMDSIVRFFFFVNSSTSITCWKVNSRRLLLCSVLSFKFKSIFFRLIKRRIVPDCGGKIPFARCLIYLFVQFCRYTF